MSNEIPKTRSVSELNKRLIKMKEEKSRLAQVGQMAVGNYNYKQASDPIPVMPSGKIGQKYYENEIKEKHFDIKEAQKAQNALQNLKNKEKLQKKNRNLSANQQQQQQYDEDEQQNQELILDQPLNELFDLPNPHFRKLFDPDAFYKINESDDEDPLEKEQREQFENKILNQDEKKNNKQNLLAKLNNNLKQKQLQQQELLEQENYNQNLESISKKNKRNLSGLKRPLKSNFKDKQNNSDIEEEDKTNKQQQKKKIQFKVEEQQTEEQKTIKNLDNKNNIPKWKKRSEAFRAAIRSGKGQEITDQENQLIVDALNKDDLIQCEHCKRKFNEKAAEKHIPLCKDKQLNEKMKTQRKKKIQYNAQ